MPRMKSSFSTNGTSMPTTTSAVTAAGRVAPPPRATVSSRSSQTYPSALRAVAEQSVWMHEKHEDHDRVAEGVGVGGRHVASGESVDEADDDSRHSGTGNAAHAAHDDHDECLGGDREPNRGVDILEREDESRSYPA